MIKKRLDAEQEIWFDQTQAPESPTVFVMACVPDFINRIFYWKLWKFLTEKEFNQLADIDHKVRTTPGFKLTYIVKIYKMEKNANS
jgi:hypothetical protein